MADPDAALELVDQGPVPSREVERAAGGLRCRDGHGDRVDEPVDHAPFPDDDERAAVRRHWHGVRRARPRRVRRPAACRAVEVAGQRRRGAGLRRRDRGKGGVGGIARGCAQEHLLARPREHRAVERMVDETELDPVRSRVAGAGHGCPQRALSERQAGHDPLELVPALGVGREGAAHVVPVYGDLHGREGNARRNRHLDAGVPAGDERRRAGHDPNLELTLVPRGRAGRGRGQARCEKRRDGGNCDRERASSSHWSPPCVLVRSAGRSYCGADPAASPMGRAQRDGLGEAHALDRSAGGEFGAGGPGETARKRIPGPFPPAARPLSFPQSSRRKHARKTHIRGESKSPMCPTRTRVMIRVMRRAACSRPGGRHLFPCRDEGHSVRRGPGGG